MPDASLTSPFEAVARKGLDRASIRDAAEGAKTGDVDARRRLAAAFAHAAFATPDRIAETYDAAAEGWQGKPVKASPLAVPDPTPESIPDALWTAFWSIIEDTGRGMGAAEITERSAALGGLSAPGLKERVVRVAHTYPGVTEAAAAPFPPRIQLDDIAGCPSGSLGAAFHSLIVDNQFDLEVLDRDALGLAALPQPLDFLNARILQTHDLWHIVADYKTTALHEIGISAFQMAQFGHSYSSMFLAVVTARSALEPPGALGGGFALLMDVILSAWAHGRQTPPLMMVPWEEVWDLSVEDLRARYGVRPYQSPYPADIIEQFIAMSAGQQAA